MKQIKCKKLIILMILFIFVIIGHFVMIEKIKQEEKIKIINAYRQGQFDEYQNQIKRLRYEQSFK